MVIIGGWVFLMSEVPLYPLSTAHASEVAACERAGGVRGFHAQFTARDGEPAASAYRTHCIPKIVLQKSTPPHTRQLILTITDKKNELTDLCGN